MFRQFNSTKLSVSYYGKYMIAEEKMDTVGECRDHRRRIVRCAA